MDMEMRDGTDDDLIYGDKGSVGSHPPKKKREKKRKSESVLHYWCTSQSQTTVKTLLRNPF